MDEIKTERIRHTDGRLVLNKGDHVAVMPSDFDPDNEMLIRVKRNAPQVWVETSDHSVSLHAEQPAWDSLHDRWDSYMGTSLSASAANAIKPVLGLGHNDCFGFVQVSTHRPTPR